MLQQVGGPSVAPGSGALINNTVPSDEVPFHSAACGCIFFARLFTASGQSHGRLGSGFSFAYTSNKIGIKTLCLAGSFKGGRARGARV